MAIIRIIVEGKWVDGKECSKCELLKPLAHFGKDKRLKDGHRSWCKKCEREKQHGYHAEYDWSKCHRRRET